MGRRLVLFDMVSLDGFFEDAEGTIDWHTVDEEFNTWAVEQLDSIGTLLFGRVTYELMAAYWPNADDDPEVAARMNRLPKAVVSSTLSGVSWENTELLTGEMAAAVRELKSREGSDIYVFGSGKLSDGLLAAGLVDEVRLMVAPVLLGAGRRLFEPVQPVIWELLEARPFGNGNVLLRYATG